MLFISNPQIFWVEAQALSRCGETPGRRKRMWDTGGRPLRVKRKIQSSCAGRGGDSLANPYTKACTEVSIINQRKESERRGENKRCRRSCDRVVAIFS